jgi:hypothetical protein
MAMEKDNTVKDFDFTEDSGVAKTPKEMKIAQDSVQTLLKEEVRHISWGGGTKQRPKVDYIDIVLISDGLTVGHPSLRMFRTIFL